MKKLLSSIKTWTETVFYDGATETVFNAFRMIFVACLMAVVFANFFRSLILIISLSWLCGVIFVFPEGTPNFVLSKIRQLILIVGFISLLFTCGYGIYLSGQIVGVDALVYLKHGLRTIPSIVTILCTTVTILLFQGLQYLHLKSHK